MTDFLLIQACFDAQRHYQRVADMWRMGGDWPSMALNNVIAEAYLMRAVTLTKIDSTK